jgi:hypothetical protein
MTTNMTQEQEQLLKLAAYCRMSVAPSGNGYWDNVNQLIDFADSIRAKDAEEIASLKAQLNARDGIPTELVLKDDEILRLKNQLAEAQKLKEDWQRVYWKRAAS